MQKAVCFGGFLALKLYFNCTKLLNRWFCFRLSNCQNLILLHSSMPFYPPIHFHCLSCTQDHMNAGAYPVSGVNVEEVRPGYLEPTVDMAAGRFFPVATHGTATKQFHGTKRLFPH